MNTRARLKIVSSGAFCNTFCPSSVATETAPAVAFTHPGWDGSVRVGVERLAPGQRADDPRTRLPLEPSHGGSDGAGLLRGIRSHRKRTVGHGALQPLDRPGGRRLFT